MHELFAVVVDLALLISSSMLIHADTTGIFISDPKKGFKFCNSVRI